MEFSQDVLVVTLLWGGWQLEVNPTDEGEVLELTEVQDLHRAVSFSPSIFHVSGGACFEKTGDCRTWSSKP